jgi:hypothetical protein
MKPSYLWLFAVLLSSPVWGKPEAVPFVTFFDGDSIAAQHPWGISTEYVILDTDLKTEACTIGPNRYAKIYLQSPRHLLIQYRVTEHLWGLKSIGSSMTLALTPDMAGKTFAISRSTDWATWNRISVDERSGDLNASALVPDSTVPLTVAMEDLSPYDRTNSLLTRHPQPMAEIADSSRGLEPKERDSLFERFKIDPAIAQGNFFPGMGSASFREGDSGYGTMFFLGEVTTGAVALTGLGLVFFEGTSALWRERSVRWQNDVIHSSEIFVGSLAVWVFIKFAAVGRAKQYAEDYNQGLATALGAGPSHNTTGAAP